MNCPRLTLLAVLLGLAGTLRLGAQGCDPAPANIVGWWPGDGNANDVVSTNNGLLGGGATASAPGYVGSAFSFDGTNSYVQIPDSPAFHPTNLTVEAWILFNSLNSQESGGSAAGNQYIIFKQNTLTYSFAAFELAKTRVNGNDVFYFSVDSPSGGSSLESTTLISTGVWYHVAGVRGSNYIQLYVNGLLQGQTTASYPQNYATLPLYFGTTGESYWDGKFAGRLDEVSLYNRALSSNEITAIFAAGTAGKCKTPNITVQPQSQTVFAGSNVSFAVSAAGVAPLSYQWQFNGANLSGATGTNLFLSNVEGINAGNYTVVVTNSFGSVTSVVATLTVLGAPLISVQPTNQTVIAGGIASFSVTATGTAPLNYQWQFNGLNIANATGSTFSVSNAQPANAGNYAVVISNIAGITNSAVAALTVLVPPSITLQPTNQTIIAGSTASFSVTATGTASLSYQWQFNGSNIGNATGSTFSVSNAQPVNAGNYAVVITNIAGTTNSAVATLTVLVPPSITLQPTNQTIIAGSTANFSVTAAGTAPLSYQWQFNGSNIANATGSTFSVSNAQPTNAGNYAVVITNIAGTTNSAVATLTVLVPPSITLQPTNQTIIAGSTANFSVTAAGTAPLSYQWQFNGPNIANATGSTFSVSNAQPVNAGNYAVVITNIAGTTNSVVATLTVLVPPSITLQPTNQTIIAGSTANFSVTAAGTAPLSYQWQFNGSNIANATGSMFSIGNAQPANAGSYAVVITNIAGTTNSATATLTVLVPPSITLQPTNQTVIAGSPASFSVTAAGTAPLSYQWQFNGSNIASATGSMFSISNAQPVNAGNYAVVITNIAGTTNSAVATLTVLVPPSITLQPTNQTVIAANPASFSVTAAGTAPLSYQWQFNGSNIANATGSTFSVSNAQPANAGSYAVVVTNIAGATNSAVATLSVLVPPSISLQPTNQTVIAGSAASFSITATGTAPLSYQWQFNGSNLANATGPALSLSNAQPTNTGSYAVVVTNIAGTTNSAVATLTVLVPPSISLQPANQAVIAGSTASFNVTATGTAPLTYQWQFNGSNLANATGPTLSLSNVQPANAGNYVVIVTNIAGVTNSTTATLSVLVPPLITLGATNQIVTVSNTVSFAVAASGSLPLEYQWYFDGIPLTNGGSISGAASSNLILGDVGFAQSGNYFAAVTNNWGTATSGPAALGVLGNLTLVAGSNCAALLPDLTVQVPSVDQWGLVYTSQDPALEFPLGVGDTNVSLSVYRSSGNVGTCTINVTVLPSNLPNIAGQPASQVVVGGTTASLTVDACGAQQMGYQWQFNGANIAQGTSATISLPNIQQSQSGYYDVVVTNSFGAVTSAVATLTVLLPPVITRQPSSQVVAGQSTVTLSVSVGGSTNGLEFQWLFNGATLADNLYYHGSTSSNLTINYVLPSQAGSYSVIVNNDVGSVRSAKATLSVSSPGCVTIPDPNLQASVYRALQVPLTNGCLTITGLAELSTLSACNQRITNLWGLEYASNLSALYLSGNGVSDLTPLANLRGLKQLVLYNNHIIDISSLGSLASLTNLDLGNNSVVDCSPITNLNLLASLGLNRNGLTDLSAVGVLSSLNFLAVGGNSFVTDFSPLSSLKNLTGLSVRDGRMSSLTILTNLSLLRSLDLRANLALSDISPLAVLSNLGSLDLSLDTAITNCAALSNSTSLSNLNLGGVAITNAGFVSNLRNLRILNLNDTAATNAAPVATLTNLTSLMLSGNAAISNYIVLTNLVGLATLELSRDAISNVGFLTNLSLLAYIDLSYNAISNLAPLANFGHLSSLVLGGNPATNFSVLAGAPALSNLWCFNCTLSNADFVTNMPWLQYLNLDGNQISNANPLSALTPLVGLSLNANLVTNYSVLSGLTNLTELRFDGAITLGGNFNILTGLSGLTFLSLNRSSASAVPPVAGLTNLLDLYLQRNHIADLQNGSNLPPRLLNLDLSFNNLGANATNGAIQDLQLAGVNVLSTPTNQPPAIVVPPSLYITANATTLLPISISEAGEAPGAYQLAFATASSVPEVIPAAGISVGQFTNSGLYLSLTPATNQTGLTTVQLTVTDDVGLATSTNIQVTVERPINIMSLCTNIDQNLLSDLSFAFEEQPDMLSSANLQSLTTLQLANASINDPCVWLWLTNLTSLSLTGPSVSNLNSMTVLSQLSSLTLYGTGVTNLSSLAGVPSLSSLTVYQSPGGLFAGPWNALPGLKSLALENDSITNVTFLTNLTQLSSLDLDGNLIADITPLSVLTNLVSLTLRLNRLSDIHTLTNLLLLTNVDVSLNLLEFTNAADGGSSDPADAAMNIISNLQSRSTPVAVIYLPQAWPISVILRPEWVIAPNTTNEIFLSVVDAADDVTFDLGACSSNTNLLPNANITLFQYKPNYWYITVLPNPGQMTETTTVTIFATNQWGLVTNGTMLVKAAPPLEVEAPTLFNPDQVWWTSGNAPWFNETNVTYDGVPAAQTGALGFNEESWLETCVNGPGIVSFWVKADAPYGGNLVFTANGTNTMVFNGVFDWRQVSTNLAAGQLELLWRYLTDVSTGNDTFWIDQVTFDVASWLEVEGVPENGQCQLLLHVTAGNLYEVLASTNLATWFPISVLTPTNSTVPLVDTNAIQGTRFYRLKELPPTSFWLEPPKWLVNMVELVLHGQAGRRFQMQVSRDLAHWTKAGVITNRLGTAQYNETLANNWPVRFYRAALLP